MNALSYPSFTGVDSATQIAYIREVFGISNTELGKIFGVERQAVAQWSSRGIPPQRSAQFDRIVELGQFLQRRLIPARIPQIVRTPGKGLGGKTVLEVLRSEGVEPIYDYLRMLAAYSPA